MLELIKAIKITYIILKSQESFLQARGVDRQGDEMSEGLLLSRRSNHHVKPK